MATPMRNRMRRSTRPADYVSKARQAESMSGGRPGGCTFSFNGEFPDERNPQPVEAAARHRNYTSGNHTGGYHAIRQDDTRRMPVINKHGVQGMTALAMLIAVVLVMSGILLAQMDVRKELENEIARKNDRVLTLASECGKVERDIALQANDMNIRQEALRMGLISARGVTVEYLQAPADAVITLQDQTAIQSLASIWGR